MGIRLRVLIVEDSPNDAELLLHELRRAGYDPAWERVESAEAMSAALEQTAWDIVIADYVLPSFNGLEALELLKKMGLDIPFMVVSGKIGEETAVQVMKAGACDYFVKGNLSRLAPSISRAMSEAHDRREHRAADAELRYLKKAFETMQIGVTITDTNRRILYTNPAEAAMHGYSVDELIGMESRKFAPPETWRNLSVDELKQARSLRRESTNLRKDGSRFPVRLLSNVVTDLLDNPVAIVTTCEDITERMLAEETLRLHKAAMESAMDGMAVLDRQGNYLYLNQAHVDMYGYEAPEELVGKSWQLLYGEEEVERFENDIMPQLMSNRQWHGEAVGRRKDGTPFPQEVSLNQLENIGMVCVVRDITERKAVEEMLRYMSSHDSLTGLYNRGYFDEELSRMARSRQFPVSVVIVDVDGLKRVNDMYGHTAGDKLLQRAATILRQAFRAEDVVARIGGDEFAVLLPSTDQAAAAEAVERVNCLLEGGNGEDESVPVRLSMGAATANEGSELVAAYTLADDRMYEAKVAGRNGGKR